MTLSIRCAALAAVGLTAFALTNACAPQDPLRKTGALTGAGGGYSGPGTGGAGNLGAGARLPLNGTGGEVVFLGSGGSSNPNDKPDACFGAVEPTETIYVDATVTDTIITYSPVALYIMQDRSGSMTTGIPEGSRESWANSTNAITAFVQDPASQNLDVGLGFFPTAPDNGWICSDGTGSGSDCGKPVVEIGPVSKNASALTAAMQNNVPSPLNFTPTECGLIGMVTHCLEWTKNSGEQCVGVLVTDGNPTLCTGDDTALAKIVSDAAAQGVKTFVLGLPGANIARLDTLAAAGGTTKAIDVTTGGQAAFIAALNAIRGKIATSTSQHVKKAISKPLACQWKIPAPPGDEKFDPKKINVTFTPMGGAPQTFGHVPSDDPADCSKITGGAWYYDDAAAPTQVLVCPDTCTMLTASIGAMVQLEFGCAQTPAKFQ